MKRMKRLYYILPLLALLNSSCKKILELEPTDGPTNSNFWNSKSACESAFTGAYVLLRDAMTENGNSAGMEETGRSMKYFILSDFRAGAYIVAAGLGVRGSTYGIGSLNTGLMYSV